jgi:hypothetical protein
MEALRSLVNYNYMQEQTGESVTITETWEHWDQLPDELQEKIEEAIASGVDDDGNEIVAPDPDLDPIEQLHQWGIFIVSGGGSFSTGALTISTGCFRLHVLPLGSGSRQSLQRREWAAI